MTAPVNDAEAETIRTVFRLYLEHGNVRRVKEEADRLGLITKIRRTEEGRMHGGRPLSRGYIYRLLSNPLYIGRIAHNGATYKGQHSPIIDSETWETVQAKLAGNAHERRSGARVAEPSLLSGMLFDEGGNRLSPSHAVKSGKRYRYYVSPRLIAGAGPENETEGFRIPAHEIETLITNALERLLLSSARLFDLLDLGRHSPSQAQKALTRAQRMAGTLRNGNGNDAIPAIRKILDRVIVAQDEVQVAVSVLGLRSAIGLNATRGNDATPPEDKARSWIKVPANLTRRGGASRLIITDDNLERAREPDPASIKVLGRAHDWFNRLATGKAQSAADIARHEGLTRSYVTRVVRLAFLAPDITEAMLTGKQPPKLNAERLVRSSRLPLSWDDQRRLLGFSGR